jgi:hypothetical protein
MRFVSCRGDRSVSNHEVASMPAKSQGESKQGLIITLVFFILATIGLGIGTYFGFAEQDKLEKAKKEAEGKAKVFQDERDWYRFQAHLYRSYVGHAENVDVAALGTKKSEWDANPTKYQVNKDNDDVKKLVGDFDKRFGWNAKENKPDRTYESEIEKLRADYDALLKDRDNQRAEAAKWKRAKESADQELAQAQATYKANLDKFSNENNKAQDDNTGLIKSLRDELGAAGAARKADSDKAELEKKTLKTQIDAKQKQINDLVGQLKRRDEEIAQFKLKADEAPPSMRTDWKIVFMDRRGLNPMINLGSADKVKPQLTFSIHGVGLDGKPISQSKGTLEVVNVAGEHLSKARITSVKDPSRDPIMKGDILYNPSWNPNIKKHVAIAGIVDLTGDGRDSLKEFMRKLARENVVVDSYLDPTKNFAQQGQITVQTDYLIIGETQQPDTGGREKNPEVYKELAKGRKLMEEAARSNGVPVIGLSRYLEMIGYRLPRAGREERPSLYDPSLRPDQAERRGGDKLPPPMPGDKK